jgi:hypothetical protein
LFYNKKIYDRAIKAQKEEMRNKNFKGLRYRKGKQFSMSPLLMAIFLFRFELEASANAK